MTDISNAITLLEQVFINSSFFQTLMIPQLIIIFATLLVVTREVSSWKKIVFPVMVGWTAFGMNISPVLLGAGGVLMVIDTLSIAVIDKGLSTIGGKLTKTVTKVGDIRKAGGVKPYRTKVKEKEISKGIGLSLKEYLKVSPEIEEVSKLSKKERERFKKQLESTRKGRTRAALLSKWEDEKILKETRRKRMKKYEEDIKKSFKMGEASARGKKKAYETY